ncbi:MAG: hypothetical protein KDE51_10015 [Anaerolineales bacterium]|nr:hypothetical protein [Anaerolineales bacterium]
MKHVLIFFLDGVGLGSLDPKVNPFVTADLPHLTHLLGEHWYGAEHGRITTTRASFVPTDAQLGVEGRPQSATGQAIILSGRNVSAAIGEHYGPKPNQAVRDEVAKGTLFDDVVQMGGTAALLTPYPQPYFDAIASGKRLYSTVPLATTNAGLPLMTADDLRQGRAVSPAFTGTEWRTHLGYEDIPEMTLHEAGQQIARIAQTYTFSFFEHWPSDRAGHRGPLSNARAHLEMIDAAYGGLLDAWDDENGLLILTSDHGNIEDKSQRQHTTNPVPTILVGQGHAELAQQIHSLADIAPAVRRFLEIQSL